MSMLTAAITQMASENDWTKNCDKAERLVRDAAAKGAKLILLQELFETPYFCIEQDNRHLRLATTVDENRALRHFRAIARELGVGSLLTGSVQRAAGQVRVNVSLVSATDGAVTWTEKYDRPLTNVFALQDEIARAVATKFSHTVRLGKICRPSGTKPMPKPPRMTSFKNG